MLHVLLAMAAVIAVGRPLGWLFRRVGQPPIIAEVVAGILLGPSFLGAEGSARLLPSAAAPLLGVVAQLGVILYLFLVGLELNAGLLRRHGPAAVVISHASILVPFLLGTLLAPILYPRFSSADVPFIAFALFLGVALSITAFPVLARILTDLELTRTDLGVLALACAALGDATAWCLLALVVGVAHAAVDGALLVTGLAAIYIAFTLLVVQPLVVRFANRFQDGPVPQGAVAAVLVGLLLSAVLTEWIGIHGLFGAFLFGAIIPHDSALAGELTRKLEDLVTILLLPAFFALMGMRTQIGLVDGLENGLLCGLIIVAASAGKFAGTLAAARWMGVPWRGAAALGVLMNTRGLMELIVLNVGLDLGILSPTLFAMMVLMALATTMATAPIVQRLLRPAKSAP
jgi:Kef-type K+ transport system membrane component KefB